MQDALVPDAHPNPEPSSSEGDCLGGEEAGLKAETSGREAEAHGANCTVCGVHKASALLDLRSNQVMQRRLSRDWKMQPDVIRSTLKAICVECVCKLNMHSEVTRTLMQRMQRLQRSTTVTTTTVTPTQLSPPIADAEVSTTLIESHEEEVDKQEEQEKQEQEKEEQEKEEQEKEEGEEEEEKQEEEEPEPEAQNPQSCRSSVSSYNGLEAYSAQPPESPSATESGGRNAGTQSGWKWRTRLECQECGRAYFRRDYFAQHTRRCLKRSRKHSKAVRTKCRVLNEASIDGEDQRLARTFHCRHCDEEFASLVILRQHHRSKHHQRFPCDLCEAQYDTKYEYEMHHTICRAKQEALANGKAGAAAESVRSEKKARSTRSRSRACSEIWDSYNEEDEKEAIESDDEELESEGEQLNEGEDDQEEAMYTRRMNFTGDWIVTHSRSNSNSDLNLPSLYDDYEPGETHMTTDKEYDLYLLDVLRTQVRLNAFACFAPECRFQTDNLVALMKHDYMEHWKMSWFYCHKCGDVFTSKVFLDYHMHRQNRGLFVCHKCRDEFEYQHQLDRHLLLHSKGINYHCNFCRLEFLGEAKLLAHCKRSGHNPNDEPLIRIDRVLSICNGPSANVPPKEEVSYEERELHIPHFVMPSLRPMHLPNHKPFRFSIGIVEFDERSPPNCVGCH